MSPGKQFDYFEPRTPGRFFVFEDRFSLGGFISTNFNRPFAINASVDIETFFEDGRDSFRTEIELSPRFRFNDHFSMNYEISLDDRNNDRGFATFLKASQFLANATAESLSTA